MIDVQAGFVENGLGLATPSRVCSCVLSPVGAFRHTVRVYCVSCRPQNHRLTTYTRRAHRLTKDRPARHTHALKNESRACERRLLHAVRPGSEAGGGKRSGHALETAARQTALQGQILMKMEASASSAISTEEKEPPTAWQRTVATLVQQLQADGDHLCG